MYNYYFMAFVTFANKNLIWVLLQVIDNLSKGNVTKKKIRIVFTAFFRIDLTVL